MQKKIEKPEAFWNNVLRTDKPNCNFLATAQDSIFWRKKGEAFV